MKQPFIPVNEPLLTGNEKKYLAECIETGWISSEGPFVKKFEDRFAASVGRKFAVAVSSGTAALEASVSALNLKKDSEVILPTFTIISCAAALIRAGLRPVLVDSDPETWNLDIGKLQKAVTPKTQAIMAVHIYGLPVDMNPVLKLAREHGLRVIEDAAEALGQTYRDRPCGSFGEVSVFSFYPNKLVTTGEGGMIVTDDEALADRCRWLRNLCFGSEDRFRHEALGWNFRMTNLQAAVGLAQLERLGESIEKKRQIGGRYTRLLSGVPGLQLPVQETEYARNIYWVYGVLLKDEIPFDAKEAMRRLEQQGIGTRPFFWPMHEQPVFSRMNLFRKVSFPAAERLSRRGFYLPSGLALTEEQIERVAEAVQGIVRRAGS